MKNKIRLLFVLVAANFFIYSSCNKSDNPPPPTPKTKTELISQSSWKFNSAKANGTDISNQAPPFDACRKDNILTFTSTGSGNVNEGLTSCSPSEATNFTWNFTTNETILHISSVLFPGGLNDFTLVSISETALVVSQFYTPPLGPSFLVVITFQH
jgi:hypothetical protein